MHRANLWEMWGFIDYCKSEDYKATIQVTDNTYATIVLTSFDETKKVTFDYFDRSLTLTISTPHIQLNSTHTDNVEAVKLINDFIPDWYNANFLSLKQGNEPKKFVGVLGISTSEYEDRENPYLVYDEEDDDDDGCIGLTD